MKSILFILGALTVLFYSNVHAKRAAPTKVKPVASGTMEYRAPQSQIGCIEAWNTESNEMSWRRQIYVIKYQSGLERDIQDIFITNLRLTENQLIVSNESNSEYSLDLNTLEVKVLKGALVESIE